MPGPNSAPNGDAGLVRGYRNEEFVCAGPLDRDIPKDKHKCGDDECKMVSRRFVTKQTGKTAKKRG
jgi:hypothetical protein